MPKLSLFAVCDKVLLDPIADQLSLIGVALRIFGQASVDHKDNTSAEVLESKFVLPELSVAAFWLMSPEDLEKKYEQLVKIVASKDDRVTDAGEPISFTVTRDYQRTVQKVVVGCRDEGMYHFALYLREAGENDWGTLRGEFWFRADPPPGSRMSVTIADEPQKVQPLS